MLELIGNPKYYIINRCELCGIEFESLIKRQQRFCCGKCSAFATGNDKDRLNKIKKTKLKRYGNATYVNPEKAKKTCLDKYGVDNVSKSVEIIEKIKETNQLKYGVDWSWMNDTVKEKIKQTYIELYGTEIASQNEDIKNKVKKTFRKNYGVDNIFQHKETMDKVYEENIKKYGTKIPVNSDKMKSETIKKNKEMYYNRLIESTKINDIVAPLFTQDEYITTDRKNKYKFQCKTCSNIFEDHIDGGHMPRCLICNPYIAGYSLHEKEIVEYIKLLLPQEKIEEKCWTILGNKEIDIYIPSKNIAIEYDGLYWHSENAGGKDKKYHLNKTQTCTDKNVQLIHIFEDEWTNKKEIVKNRLKHILGCNIDTKVYARKCIIKELESKECVEFLNKYHIQGSDNSGIKIGAYYKDELISVMTFGNKRSALGSSSKKGEYELYRFASNKNVIGIASKLLQYFIKTHKPSKIISYADRRWSIGNLYEKIGFKKISITPPNYWYFMNGYNIRYHRFNFAKHTLSKKLQKFDKNLTEYRNMQLNGYDRIWDCGSIKYELILQY